MICTISKVLGRAHRTDLQAYYTEYDKQVEMNKMRYAKSNAKDYAQHAHPIKASSAAVLANAQTLNLLIPTDIRKFKTFWAFL